MSSDERALLVRALEAARDFVVSGPDKSERMLGDMRAAIASGVVPQPDASATKDALEMIDVLLDPLAQQLLKEADRGA